MKKPKIVELDNKINFYKTDKVQNVDFTYSRSLVEYFYTYAKVDVKSGYVYSGSDRTDYTTTHKMIMRYDERITSDLVVKIDDIEYKILGINRADFDKKGWLVLDVDQISSAEC